MRRALLKIVGFPFPLAVKVQRIDVWTLFAILRNLQFLRRFAAFERCERVNYVETLG